MEINNINNNPISDIGLLSANNLQSNEIVNNDLNSLSNSYAVSQNINPQRSNLYSNLNQHISTISQSQIELSNLNKQNDILSNISSILQNVNQASNIPEASIQVHDELNNLMSKYDITKQSDSGSHSYFDGAFGATPLKIDHLAKDVQQKQSSIKEHIQEVSHSIEMIQDKALNIIQEEVVKTQTAQPFKNVDFGKNINDFSSANINSIIGSVALSQANAVPAHSPRLLA
jgi:prophage DNA circulation protein